MRILKRSCKGFSLLEVVVAMAAFTVIMMGIIQIMAQGTRSFRAMQTIQNNIQDVQFAVNTMAKELRTSSIVDSSIGAVTSRITFFDYSQNRCIEYRADENSHTLSKRSHGFASTDPNANQASCAGYTFTETYVPLVSNLVSQSFAVNASNQLPNPAVGRVTIAITVGPAGDQTTVQTTVSLRDFNYIGI